MNPWQTQTILLNNSISLPCKCLHFYREGGLRFMPREVTFPQELIIQKAFQGVLKLSVHKLALLLGCCRLKGHHGPVQQCIKKIYKILNNLKSTIKKPQALNRIKCQLNTFSKSWSDSLTSFMLSASLQTENPIEPLSIVSGCQNGDRSQVQHWQQPTPLTPCFAFPWDGTALLPLKYQL